MRDMKPAYHDDHMIAIPPKAWLAPLIPLLIWGLAWVVSNNTDLFYTINRIAQNWPEGSWAFFVYLGNGWGMFALTIPLVLFAPRMLTACIIGASLAGLVSRFFKLSLAVPRPAAVLDNSTFHIIGEAIHHHAMPSGHTLTAFAVATSVYFCMPPKHRIAALWVFVVATLSGMARIAIGAHWPADVFAGAALGMLGGLVGTALVRRLPASWFRPSSWWLCFVTYAGGAVAFYMTTTQRLDLDISRPIQTLSAVIVLITIIFFTHRLLTRSSVTT